MKQEATTTRKRKEIELFVARSGPKKGKPECEAAFATKPEAVAFLTSQHGLDIDEAKKLGKNLSLPLDRRWHGADICSIEPATMSPLKAKQALSGELYTPKIDCNTLPTPRAISMKTTLKIKLKEPKRGKKRSRRKVSSV
jgi:hypothetical protein